jgi:hypothetical protein
MRPPPRYPAAVCASTAFRFPLMCARGSEPDGVIPDKSRGPWKAGPCYVLSPRPMGRAAGFLPVVNRKGILKNSFLPVGNKARILLTKQVGSGLG